MEQFDVCRAVRNTLEKRLEGTVPLLEAPPQSLEQECFWLDELNREQSRDQRTTYVRHSFVLVQYHPGSQSGPVLGIPVARNLLFDLLPCVELEGRPLRADSLRDEVKDGVLLVLADYPLRLSRIPESIPTMQELNIQHNKKGE